MKLALPIWPRRLQVVAILFLGAFVLLHHSLLSSVVAGYEYRRALNRVDINDDLIEVLDNRSMIDTNSLHISCLLAYEDGSNIAFENNGLDYHIRSSLSNLGAVFDVSVDMQVLHGIRREKYFQIILELVSGKSTDCM